MAELAKAQQVGCRGYMCQGTRSERWSTCAERTHVLRSACECRIGLHGPPPPTHTTPSPPSHKPRN